MVAKKMLAPAAAACALLLAPGAASAWPTFTGPGGQPTSPAGVAVVDASGAQTGNADTPALVTLAAAAAGTTNSVAQTNYTSRGVQVGVNLTITTCSVVVNIQGQDAASSAWYTILASAAISSTSFTNLTVYPGAAATTNVSSPQPLPKTWRVQTVLTGGSCAVTGTVGASTIN